MSPGEADDSFCPVLFFLWRFLGQCLLLSSAFSSSVVIFIVVFPTLGIPRTTDAEAKDVHKWKQRLGRGGRGGGHFFSFRVRLGLFVADLHE